MSVAGPRRRRPVEVLVKIQVNMLIKPMLSFFFPDVYLGDLELVKPSSNISRSANYMLRAFVNWRSCCGLGSASSKLGRIKSIINGPTSSPLLFCAALAFVHFASEKPCSYRLDLRSRCIPDPGDFALSIILRGLAPVAEIETRRSDIKL